MDCPREARDWAAPYEDQERAHFAPSWFLIGAEKAGTTSAWHYLRQHPGLALPKPKEPNFYSHALDRATTKQGRRDARGKYLWPYVDEPGTPGDCSTSYLWHPEAAQRIHDDCPDARILVLLRDPVERAWSHYLMHRRVDDNVSFTKAHPNHPWIDHSRYGEQLARYVDLFGRRNICVRFTEGLEIDPCCTMAAFQEHVGVEASWDLDVSKRHNIHRRAPGWMQHPTVRKVARYLLPESARTAVADAVSRPARRPVLIGSMRERVASWLADDVDDLRSLGVLEGDVPLSWHTAFRPWHGAQEPAVDVRGDPNGAILAVDA